MKRRGLKTSRRFTLCRSLSALLIFGSAGANADSVEDFYRGKTVNFEIGDASGGGYDIYAHFVARFLGTHIPGNPTIVARNMPGAGSRTATGYVYKVAAPDGLTIGASEEALPLEQAVGDETIPFDTAKLNWIGSPDSDNKVVVTWFTSGVKTIEDAKNRDVQMGASADTTSSQYMNAMNALIGTRFKIVYGYPGGGDINLAMERGEVAGRGSSSWATWKAKPEVLRDHKINVLVQIGFDKASGLEDVPLLIDLGDNADDREIFKLLSAPTAIGHPIFTSPGVPPERVNALRAAFDATMRDPAFLDEARKLKLDIQPTQGQKLQQIVADILSAPKPIRERLAPIIITRTQSKAP